MTSPKSSQKDEREDDWDPSVALGGVQDAVAAEGDDHGNDGDDDDAHVDGDGTGPDVGEDLTGDCLSSADVSSARDERAIAGICRNQTYR